MKRGENLVALALKKIEAWLDKTAMADSRLGQLACANVRAVERVRAGSGSVDTLKAILDYIEKNPAKNSDKAKMAPPEMGR